MIYTITFNPSIDYIVKVEDFKLGEVNRMKSDSKYPGGKGINVSRVLKNLNVESKALGFIGGFTGEYVKDFLEKEGVETDFIKIHGDTRINVKLKCSVETEVNGKGPQIEEEDLEKLFKKIESLKAEDIVVLAGNVQSNLPRDIYKQIQLRCKNNNVKFVIDTTGESLVCTLVNKPILIKPNVDELADIFKAEIKSREQIMYYGRKLVEMGAQNVIVSMAGDGAILISNRGLYYASAPKGIVKNSVGAGDSLIAGFLAKISENYDIIEAFRWGIASGSATAFSQDLCSKNQVENLVSQVNIEEIKYTI